MTEPANPSPNLDQWLAEQAAGTTLRFLTCGSVDDGKSTLIGRLLHDAKLIFDDQLMTLESDSRKQGKAGPQVDFALLVDGLAAEREQGITIDVAYRYFATDRRKFVVADTPGHEQYTRNMATGASNSELAVILVDAQKGVLTQTRRHTTIAHLFGIRDFVLAINKMDLVDYDEAVFAAIEADYRVFAARLGECDVTSIPVSALAGDNITAPSARLPWYQGPALLPWLESVVMDQRPEGGVLRLPIQRVSRPDAGFRGFCGNIASGTVAPGQPVLALPSGQVSRVRELVAMNGPLPSAVAGEAVTLTLADEIDLSRGDVLCDPEQAPPTSDQLAAHLLWMSDDKLIPGRQYRLKCAARTVGCVVTQIKHALDVDAQSQQAARNLGKNEIGVVNLSLGEPIVFEPFARNRTLGSFILIDRQSNATVGAGMFDFSLRRADNVTWQALSVDKAHRAALKHQRPCVIWLTGLSGSGKSTLANLLESRLHDLHRHTYVLDGDNVRHGLTRDLGFTETDRVENIRRIGETAKLMVDAGLIVLVAFISPYRSDRRMVRGLMDVGEFIEVFVDTPLAVCESRDPKGLYRKARSGQLQNFTGVDAEYQRPNRAELTLDTVDHSPEENVEQLLAYLKDSGFLST